jgi:hypothetical protein
MQQNVFFDSSRQNRFFSAAAKPKLTLEDSHPIRNHTAKQRSKFLKHLSDIEKRS